MSALTDRTVTPQVAAAVLAHFGDRSYPESGSFGQALLKAKRFTLYENAVWWWTSHHLNRPGGGVS